MSTSGPRCARRTGVGAGRPGGPYIYLAGSPRRARKRRRAVLLSVASGLRSPATQQRLFDQAIAKYGSKEKARRWVLPPAESAQVRYGLCRCYANEWWHFERPARPIGQRWPALQPCAGG